MVTKRALEEALAESSSSLQNYLKKELGKLEAKFTKYQEDTYGWYYCVTEE